jgi:hypothetical protein
LLLLFGCFFPCFIEDAPSDFLTGRLLENTSEAGRLNVTVSLCPSREVCCKALAVSEKNLFLRKAFIPSMKPYYVMGGEGR